MYVNDLALRVRVESVGAGEADVAVVDLSDERAVEAFLADRPSCPALGFYPHVRRDLAELAREHGIEPIEKRVFFADTAAVLGRFASR